MENYRRISIVGNSAAGKSTLARKIGRKLDIEIFTIDKIYWLPGWKLREQNSFKELHDNWLSRDSWIIDGVGYLEELENRLNCSDLVIYYNVPVSVCMQRAENRINEEKIEPNHDIVEGCRYGNVRDFQMRVIENFEVELKPKIMKYIDSLNSEKVRIISNESELCL